MDFFLETTFRPLGGAAPWNFTRAKDWPSFASAHPKVEWGLPRKKIWSRKCKIWPKIGRFKVNNFRVSGSTLTGLLSVDAPLGRGDNLGTIFTSQCQKFVTVKKLSKIFSDFWQISILIANISGTDQQIESRNSYWKSTTPPTLHEKKLVYFGPQTKKLLTLINVHPNGLFSGDYISALRGCCALKFLNGLKTDQALLAHTPRWNGVPPEKKIWSRKCKIWPKIGRFKVNNFRASGSILTGLFSFDVPRGRSDNVVQFLQGPLPKICDGHKIVQNF